MKHPRSLLQLLLLLLLPGFAALGGCAAPDSFSDEVPVSRFSDMAVVPSPAAAASPASLPQPEPGVARRIPLTVRETAGVARSGEIVQSGVPLPRSLAVLDPAKLAVVDPAGKPVPADFRVLARWNAGRADPAAPIQWLLVAFPASVGSKGSATYTLVTDGSAGANPAPARPLRLLENKGEILVDTGVAVFRLGADPGALFDEVRLTGKGSLVSGGEMTLQTAGTAGGAGAHRKLRRISIEHAGPLTAAVVLDGDYGLPPAGGGGFGSRRRYVFHAGSPTALVRHAVAWEGMLGCQGCIVTEDRKPNGVLVEKARDTLRLSLGGPAAVTAVGDFEAPALEAGLGEGQTATVRQLLRPKRLAPFRFEVAVAGRTTKGDRADGGLLAASGPSGTVAVALSHMHRYEPQALRLLADGQLAVDLADDKAWLAHHQGLFANLAVSALSGRPTRSDLDRLVWAPLNRPLRAWPDAAWWAASQAVPEIPAGRLPKELAEYDKVIPWVLDKTVKQSDAEGFAGLMTYGLYPRYWGRDNFSEIQCSEGAEPTPGAGWEWDEAFWCGSWTDYHSTLATPTFWAMRSGEVEWLDELSFPGAWRMLHTQIMQCGPEPWFYCGQAPAGYSAYRSDFNSSHAYWENLYLYYWLTGDSLVVDTLQRGGDSMRRRACDQRGPGPVVTPTPPAGPACPPDHPPSGENFVGRVTSQWTATFRFLGLASADPTFLEDYRSNLARAVTQNYVEVERDGKRYGLLGDKIGEAGPFWISGFYDAENLYRFMVDTQDEPIGNPPLKPSRVLTAMARTVVELESRALGDRSLKGRWPLLLDYSWSGPRIGGKLVRVEPRAKEREHYGPEKAGNVALLVRAGQMSGDPVLIAASEELVQMALEGARGEGVGLGKLQGQYLTRLHGAVGRLAAGGTPKVPAAGAQKKAAAP